MDEPTLLPAIREDAPALLAMILALADYERLTHLVAATEASLAAALFEENPVAQAVIAWETPEKRQACGFALFFQTFSTFLGRPGLWLEDIFVYPAYRSRGVGKALLARVAQVARDWNCGRLEWSVLDWNAHAIAFYERAGATVLPDWRIVRVTGDALTRFGRPVQPDQSPKTS